MAREWTSVTVTHRQNTADDPGPDDVLAVLAHPVRRTIVSTIGGTDSTSLEHIASAVEEADGEGASDVDASGGTDALEIDLHHRHLPKMAAAGVIEYDPRTGEVETTDATDRVYAILAAAREEDS